MALTICPECKKIISDKAKECVHCGFPVFSVEDFKNIVNENITAETQNTKDVSAPSKQADNITTKPKKKNMGCGIIVIIIIAVILIACLFGGEDHDDGKCDICGESGAIQAGSNAELCINHIIKANNQYYKGNENYGGF